MTLSAQYESQFVTIANDTLSAQFIGNLEFNSNTLSGQIISNVELVNYKNLSAQAEEIFSLADTIDGEFLTGPNSVIGEDVFGSHVIGEF